MEDFRYKLLLHGFDTLQCAYFLRQSSADGIDFQTLAKQREEIRQTKMKETVPVKLGNTSFLLHPYGTASGYPFVISNEDYKIEFGQFNNPSFFVTFKSQALWRESAFLLHEKFMRWADSVGFGAYRTEGLSRVDFSFDYHMPIIDFNEDDFVSRCNKDSQHRENGKVQTFTFGRGDIVLRVYDKVAEVCQQSNKVWLYLLWGQETDVWRIEWQVRKDILRQFGIRTFEDLKKCQGDLLRYLSEEHTTLRVPNGDGNRARWPLHSLWVDLQEKIGQLDRLGVSRIFGKTAVLEERMVRIGIIAYGYLKAYAAVHCVQNRMSMIDEHAALFHLMLRMWRVHDSLNWRIEVKNRIDAIEHGEW